MEGKGLVGGKGVQCGLLGKRQRLISVHWGDGRDPPAKCHTPEATYGGCGLTEICVSKSA